MVTVNDVRAREILDSRGNPTIEVDLFLEGGAMGRASVPSGASVGAGEASVIYDGDPRFNGKGFLKSIDLVQNVIRPVICRREVRTQHDFDQMLLDLDGTPDKSHLGASAILATSLAFAKAVAASLKEPLFVTLTKAFYGIDLYSEQWSLASHYKRAAHILSNLLPMVNIINGGKHADNELQIQEFMIVPVLGLDERGHIEYGNPEEYSNAVIDRDGGRSIMGRIQVATEVFHTLRRDLKQMNQPTSVGDEGGFAPRFHSAEDALDAIVNAIKNAGYYGDVRLALDVAASTFLCGEGYKIYGDNKGPISKEGLLKYYQTLISSYPIISIEDPFAEDDIEMWQRLTALDLVQIVGDDIFVTNPRILMECIPKGVATAVLIKPNQIGTLTETFMAVSTAKKAKKPYNIVTSHRSGETEDVSIVHLGIAVGSRYVKFGSMCRTDRTCKYNELLRINELVSRSLV